MKYFKLIHKNRINLSNKNLILKIIENLYVKLFPINTFYLYILLIFFPPPPFHSFFPRYPAQIVRVDTSGKRFDRQSAARKSLLHVQTGLHAIEDVGNDSNTDSVKRRSRSRKPRGNRRNTIAGIDQKEIEGITVNGFVITFYMHIFFPLLLYSILI